MKKQNSWKKKTVVIVPVLMMIALLLVGCPKGGGAPAPPPSTKPEATPTPTTASAPAPATKPPPKPAATPSPVPKPPPEPAATSTPAPPAPTTTALPTLTPTPTPPPAPKPETILIPAGWQVLDMPTSPTPRTGHAMTTQPGGDALMFGGKGVNGLLQDTWVLDKLPANIGHRYEDWVPSPQQTGGPTGRQGHQMVTTSDGRAVMFGGTNDKGTSFNDMYSYKDGKWTVVTPVSGLPPARFKQLMWQVNDDVYIEGGVTVIPAGNTTLYQDLWRFDFKSNSWKKLQDPPDFISPHAFPLINGGKVYFLDAHRLDALAGTVYIFNIERNSWENRKVNGEWPHGERSGYMTTQVGSKAYMTGGKIWDNSANTFKDTTESWLFDLDTFSWKRFEDIPVAISDGAAVYDSGLNRLFYFGAMHVQLSSSGFELRSGNIVYGLSQRLGQR